MKLNSADVEQLVTEHYANLFRFALSLSRNEPEAADLTQQTYFKLATNGGQIRDTSKAKSWLFTTLYREFLAQKRQSNRFTDIEDIDMDEYNITPSAPDVDAIRRADARLVMDSLGRIRDIFRVPLSLFYIEDLSYLEIAEILDLPIGTVMSRLSRGKNELRTLLTEAFKNEASPENIIPLPKASNE